MLTSLWTYSKIQKFSYSKIFVKRHLRKNLKPKFVIACHAPATSPYPTKMHWNFKSYEITCVLLSVVMTNARRAPAYIPRHAIRIPICPAFSCAMLVVRGFFSFVFGIPVQETKKSGFQILWCCYIWSPPQNLDLPGQVLRHLHRKLDVKHAIFTTCVSVYETFHSARSARGRAHQLNPSASRIASIGIWVIPLLAWLLQNVFAAAAWQGLHFSKL